MSIELFNLTGKRALITGSSQGIGYSLATALGAAGAEIILNGRNAEKLEKSADKLRAKGLTIHPYAFDVTEPDQVTKAIDRIEKEVGAIDILVNNTGIQIRGVLEEFEYSNWQKLMRANLDSVFIVSQAVVKHMISRSAGKIINICSVQSELARYSIAPYTASKGGVKMLTKGMCTDWARYNIQVNGIAPGYFETELTDALVKDKEFTAWLSNRTPSQRWGKVEELSGAVIYLASAGSSFVNGHILSVDGGITSCL